MTNLELEIRNAEQSVNAADLVVRQSQEILQLRRENLARLKLQLPTNESAGDTRTLLNG